ncbi:polysaccharide deacetylase family protein [Jannaschia sp. M317]|uniref:polysaccharide deacetylase family protein n=1 Tax=Jannaschia sp. M317 TaxID=2867011 RepID=UPI0021A72683|nr:polysaccharide deacetylase family protein [Jannaschia sp. M317]UWQ19150.1 polysaccharide deacetylase family protein [Jannaschia sp. M317]
MDIAFTLDDLPLWPQSDPPAGVTAAGIVADIRRALAAQGVAGVYAFCNSWPLARGPGYARILDDWLADGHHVGNHTHSHPHLPEVSAAAFIADIDAGSQALAPWLDRAPRRLFRHPLCHWGETQAKLAAVNAHLTAERYTAVDVTSFSYEWTFNRAWLAAREAGDRRTEAWVCDAFLTFAPAQLRHDHAAAAAWFGTPVPSIALGHNVAFFAVMAQDYLAALRSAGARFVPLADALDGPVQAATGSVVSAAFRVIQQKLALAAGHPIPQIAPDHKETFNRITALAAGRSD